MANGTRTPTAFENLLGVISTASKMTKVVFGGVDTASWMINFLGALSSNVAGRGMDLIGTPYPIGVEAVIYITGAGGGSGYGGGLRSRIPIHLTNKARVAVSAAVLINQDNTSLTVTGTPWARFGYSTDGFASVTYITAIAPITTHTSFAITTADIPVDALVFCELSAGAGEVLAGTATLALR